MTLAEQLNATVIGLESAPRMVLVHGFGGGQEQWSLMAGPLSGSHRLLTFDLPGAGAAHPAAYDTRRHTELDGYRDDVIALLDELGWRDVVLVGHSVGAIITVLVQVARPDLVARLVLLTPSARYLDDVDGGYRGGFLRDDVEELLELIARNPTGWQGSVGSLIAGGEGGSETVRESMAPLLAAIPAQAADDFARATFLGDNRADLARVTAPTLVVQSAHDVVAPMSAGRFVCEAVPGATMVVLDTVGHAPHLSAPRRTVAAIEEFAGARV